MKQTAADPPDIDSKRSGAIPKAHGVFGRLSSRRSNGPILPLNNQQSSTAPNSNGGSATASQSSPNGNASRDGDGGSAFASEKAKPAKSSNGSSDSPPSNIVPIASSQSQGQGPIVGDKEGHSNVDNANENSNINNDDQGSNDGQKKKRTLIEEVRHTFWLVATYSWLNVLLVFVPVGIVVGAVPGINGGIVFGINCIAVIPLAGLLAFATESVASKMGDSLGALLNVTFGNAVELIIFIIALVKNEIRIVQASLLGSILANLLLILGMGFFLGGLRYREQIYNSTVTQMSACLLSLSVISLVLPTAFHASFKDSVKADRQSLKISRGTSVILLLVYIMYLLFQLRSHAYMYESTPQHILDAESTPGPAAGWLDTSSSDSSSSSSSDTDDSRDTIGRKMKKVLRAKRRRKSSVASVDTADLKAMRNEKLGTGDPSPNEETISETSSSRPGFFPRIPSSEGHDDSTDDEKTHRHRRHRMRRHSRRKHKKRSKRENQDGAQQPTIKEGTEHGPGEGSGDVDTRRVDFAVPKEEDKEGGAVATESGNESGTASKRPFPTLRALSVKNLAPNVFVQKPDPLGTPPVPPAGPVPRVRYGIRRTNSLPDRLHEHQNNRPPGAMFPSQIPHVMSFNTAATAVSNMEDEDKEEHFTRTAAIILLLVTTGLVAACAEFLVGSIKEVTENSNVKEIFIGLIILPIVGNAAEHVTAITVAMKNKMDLAIGVAVGSSIQIALFVTPLVVILGWIMDKAMSLYFTLFETVCLFVSTFIVNFLVLDGRSNYLEGALLCAVYIIIAIVAFFYPNADEASAWGD